MPADLQKARELFLHAVGKLPPEQWDGYVAEACDGDAELGRQVRRLLQVHREAGSFLDRPAAAVGATGAFPPAPGEEAGAVPLRERPGTIIGPYKLLQQIGEGGMGTVFMAEQTHPVQRKVALKVIKAGMDSRQVIARFEAERQALATMDHVNIARVLDAGATESGLPYFVMELIHGVPITKYCDDNHLTPRERLELFVPVCLAIQHAHQKGVIHRDVKPSNVMITLYDGKPVPKVIDFGVAKAMEQKLTELTLFTQYGAMVGTLEYMSPEQAEMSGLGVDTRSDIYSLGVLLYELLTGSTPLSHKRVREAAYGEVLRMIKEEEPQRPSTRLSDSGAALATISAQRHMEPAKLAKLMRGELDWIVMKTLEKDRNRRYPTANGFAADVQRYLKDEPVQACPPTVGYRFRKFARRNKRILATVGLLALALITGTMVSAWQAIRATEAEGLAQTRLHAETEAQNATRAQLRLTEEAQEKATRRLYDARLAQAKAGSLSRRPGQRLDSLDALAEAGEIARGLNLPPERLLERRNAAIACLALTDLRLSKQGLGWSPDSRHADFDGKMEQVAVADEQGAVSIRRVADDVETARLPATGSGTGVLFSRDGKFLAVYWDSGRGDWTHCRLNLWKLGGDVPVQVEHLDDVYGIDFSADSRQCAIGCVGGPIRLYDLASGQPPRELPKGRPGAQLAFHPDGRQLAVSCDTSVEIRALDTGKVVADLQGPVAPNDFAWRPDGKTLAVVGSDSRIYLWDVAAGKQTLVIEGLRNHGIHIAFNHAGDLLASTGWEGMLRLWDPQTGKQLFSTVSGIEIPRFSLDDRLLSGDVRDGKLGLWEVAAGGEYRTLVRAAGVGNGAYEITAIRSDGRLLAVTTHDGVGLWELPSGKELSFLESPGTNFVLFEPSGALLTCGYAGLLRWPVQADPASPGLLRIGPPQKLSVPGPIGHIACSHDGRVIAVSQFQGGRVLLADRPDQPVPLGPHDDARYVAVSPDGLWVATGSHNGAAVKIWEARSGECMKELPADGSRVGFSPDGKWLATWGRGGAGLRLWAVGSWQEGAQIGGGVFAFSPDLTSPSGKLLAVETGYGAVRLVDPDTGREYARLEDPNQDRAFWMSFNADGTQLIVSNNDSQSIHVWDLRAIRSELAARGLDWDLPPYPPPAPDLKPLRVEVDPGEIGAMIQAQDYWQRALPLALCPDPKYRDPRPAVELGTKAVQLAPKDGNCWFTLGVAQYRAGNWKAALESLEKGMPLRNGGDCGDWFFLAMVHWQLGDKAEARQWYDRADLWMATHHNPAWPPLRAEAAELMKIESGVENPESPKKQMPR